MNESPHDPLLESLAQEAGDLSARAAAAARQRQAQRRKTRERLAYSAVVIALGVVLAKLMVAGGTEHLTQSTTAVVTPNASTRLDSPAQSVPELLPAGLSPEQAKVVSAAQGQPLLLVRDKSGKVARIHVVQR